MPALRASDSKALSAASARNWACPCSCSIASAAIAAAPSTAKAVLAETYPTASAVQMCTPVHREGNSPINDGPRRAFGWNMYQDVMDHRAAPNVFVVTEPIAPC